jgi:diguanylate cyclase (GGDEF)-like protein/PAS domain S-box-containing protein
MASRWFTRNPSPLKKNKHWGQVDSDRVLKTLLLTLDGMVFRCALDAHWTIQFVSDASKNLTGYAPEDFLGNQKISLEKLTHPEDRESVREDILRAVADSSTYGVQYRIQCRDGSEKWVRERGMCVQDESGMPVLEGFIEDVSEQVLSYMRRAEVELRYASIFEHSVVGMFQTTQDGDYLAANQALAELYGYASPQHLMAELSDIGRSLYVDPRRRDQFSTIISLDGKVRDFESEVYRRQGQKIWISENAHAVRGPDGEFLYYEGTVDDVSQRRRYQAELEYQATHDTLTGLANRSLLHDRLHQAIEQSKRYQRSIAVAFVDLDNFKIINDSLGHAVGDALLREISNRLASSLRAVDTVARYGGDEFVLILCDQQSMADLSTMLERILARIAEVVVVGNHQLQVSGSIGVTVFPEHGGEVEDLLTQADAAMYHAKVSGRGQHQFYSPELSSSAHQRLGMEMALRHALEHKELMVYYQPKVDSTGTVAGFEALIRWYHPTLGMVSPTEFIPIAEDIGLINPITDFVLREACQAAARWGALGWAHLHMAVNLSARQFSSPHLRAQIEEVLAESGMPAGCLQLEITESVLIGDTERTVEVLVALKQLGVRIAIDDFGTGYSSLAYLKRFPLDILKIDRSFVMEVGDGRDGMAIPKAVISLGHSLGLSIVAEGVEYLEQFNALLDCGCEEFQGYYFSPPLPQGAIDLFLIRSKDDSEDSEELKEVEAS